MVCTKRAHKVQLAGVIYPVTSAPYILASCTANVPAPPPAPLIQTFWLPGRPLYRRFPCRAMTAACGMAAASSKVTAWFSANALSRAHLLGKTTHTRQDVSEDLIPCRKRLFVPATSTRPAMSDRVSADVVLEAPRCGHKGVCLSVLPVRSIYGYRMNLDQYFIVLKRLV